MSGRATGTPSSDVSKGFIRQCEFGCGTSEVIPVQKEPLSTLEMRVLELNAQYLGVSLSMLMQAAGREVARVVTDHEKGVDRKRVVILCGGGGNGGDGMVAARHLHEAGATVDVYLIGSEHSISSEDTRFNWSILKNLDGIPVHTLRTESAVRDCEALRAADILVDAMLGFGLRSPLREPILSAVRAFNAAGGRKYAIDVPTGINADSGEVLGEAVRADVTITLHAPKPGLLKAGEYVGELVVVPIGIPPEAYTICGDGDLWVFNRPRKSMSKKGDYGRVLVVGGSNVFSGAPALSALGALRTGADLVSVVAPEPVVGAIRSFSPNLMVRSTGTTVLSPDCVDVVLDAARANDVVAIGPGLGRDDTTVRAVRQIVGTLTAEGTLMVIDADGLKAIAGSGLRLDPETVILTPHWGELGILLGDDLGPADDIDNRVEHAVQGAREYNSTVLLKGPIDVIASPDGRHKLNKTGVPAMTVGGTGDVLTGICAALLARGRGAFLAASAAAFISGLAGEIAHSQLGDHITATDCIGQIPEAMRGVFIR